MPPARRPATALILAGLASTLIAATPAIALKRGAAVALPAAPVTPVTTATPVRLAASALPLTDAAGRVFQPDSGYAVGGALTVSAHFVKPTASPQLYQNARAGGTGYRVPVATPGTYFVDLFVAETKGGLPGQRVWNVTAEGAPAATGVDIAREAGQNKAWHVMFATPVTDGVLDLGLSATAGKSLVGAVAVSYQSAATAPVTTFDEEFSGAAGSGPDASRWTPAYGGNGFGNGELQYYTGRPDNVTTDGAGNLVITARKEPFTGADGVTRQYTSAKLSTLRTFSFQYGTVTSRMRIPANGPGLLPALWALGTDLPDVGWPHCGEIDIMENIGSEPTIAHATLHGGTTAGLEDWVSAGVYRSDAPVGSEFRTFELVWGPDGISGRADGHTFFTVGASDIAPGHEWSFNHPFFLVLNLAVGGDWPGSPDATTVFPASMAVDYVRVSA